MPITSESETVDQYRRRTGAFALLNLSVLAAVLLLHVSFMGVLGPPRPALIAILMTLFTGQIALLLWLQGLHTPPPEGTDRAVAIFSIAVTVLGAFLASLLGEGDEHHYFVLMLAPVVLAAFRLGAWGTFLAVLSASALTMGDIWHWYHTQSSYDVTEFFEAATVCLLFAVVGVVVHFLTTDLRRRGARLSTSLAALHLAQDRVVASEKLAAVGRLSSAIAHEIRNPVAMIHSSLAAAARGGLDEEARTQMHAVAMQEAERLERLTSDFLAYAHTRTPQRQDADALGTLSVVAELVRARATEADVALQVEAGAARGKFDPFMLHQALLNLALNGVSAAPRNGHVSLASRRENGGLVFTVTNDGEAVPAEAVHRIFEPFFTTRAGGTGLGLAIARSIARAHGGDAWLEDNSPGAVRFALRVADAPAPEA
jgi:signal transduction histidine kinase